MNTFTSEECDRIIEMAWEDRTPFEAIEAQFGLKESDVIQLMRQETPKSFKRWRKRVTRRKTKHQKISAVDDLRFRCSRQKHISNNKISKRT